MTQDRSPDCKCPLRSLLTGLSVFGETAESYFKVKSYSKPQKTGESRGEAWSPWALSHVRRAGTTQDRLEMLAPAGQTGLCTAPHGKPAFVSGDAARGLI